MNENSENKEYEVNNATAGSNDENHSVNAEQMTDQSSYQTDTNGTTESLKDDFEDITETKNTENIIKNELESDLFAEESYYDNHPLPNPAFQGQMPNQPQFRSDPSIPPVNPNTYQQPFYGMPPQNGMYPRQQENFRQQDLIYPQTVYNPQNNTGSIPPVPPVFVQENADSNNAAGPVINEPKKKHTGLIIAIVVILILIFGIVAPIAVYLNSDEYQENRNNNSDRITETNITEYKPAETEFTINETPQNDNASVKDKDGRLTTEGIAEKASPSVVGVLGLASTFQSQGSGIVLSEDGYVITNAHIIEECSAVKIILNGEDEYDASIIGTNVNADIAVLKFTPDTELVAAELGESSKLKIGEQVITIGNPRGLWGTFTGGYVSGIRDMPIDKSGTTMTYIQTDAPVNYGNSGGPILNMYGQVIGIVSSKYTQDSAEGLGFAIAIDDALPIIEGIIENQKVMNNVKIGITFKTITSTDAEYLGIEPGYYVAEIDQSCDIANTELRKGDIITHINGVRVYTTADIANAVGNKKPGDTVIATVYRKSSIGEVETFEIEFKLMQK